MFNIQKQPLYDEEAVQPMRDELIYAGFKELKTPGQVDAELLNKDDQTVFVVINSVCGCAAGSARPGAVMALQHNIIPDKLVTVFAGQDRDAVDRVRELMPEVPPSSPSMAIFKNGEPIFVVRRLDIEGYSAEHIAGRLVAAFDKFCGKQGPSISKEAYDKLVYYKTCGSKITLNQN
jgi:putative YphP/YqiW family bacilliredoxin